MDCTAVTVEVALREAARLAASKAWSLAFGLDGLDGLVGIDISGVILILGAVLYCTVPWGCPGDAA